MEVQEETCTGERLVWKQVPEKYTYVVKNANSKLLLCSLFGSGSRRERTGAASSGALAGAMATAATTLAVTPQRDDQQFMSQRPQLSRRAGQATRKARKKKGGKKGQSPRRAQPDDSEDPLEDDGLESLDVGSLRQELADLRSTLTYELERTDKMQQTAEVALRALDAHLADGRWSTVVSPPDGVRAGHTFQWMDASKGISATAVTVPPDWTAGPVLVRLHRTPVPPRLPPPSLGAPPPVRPLRPFDDYGRKPVRVIDRARARRWPCQSASRAPSPPLAATRASAAAHATQSPSCSRHRAIRTRPQLAGVAETRPVKFSTEWKEVFKAAGIRKTDLADPVKVTRTRAAHTGRSDVHTGRCDVLLTLGGVTCCSHWAE